jgi:hypothetical protein
MDPIMKKIFKYMLVAFAALSLGSCTSLLDQEPLDSFTDEAVWGDLSLAEVYLNAQYSCNGLRGENSKNVRYACFVDELFHKHGYGTANTTHTEYTPSQPYIWYYEEGWRPWNTFYGNISRVNLFLENIDGVPAEGEDNVDKRNRMKGEGLFLRAWNYHMLYAIYGRVVLVDHVYDLDATFDEGLSDMDAVADFIVKDLDAAIALLPLENESGRATKGAAMALKARVLLYKASPLFGTPSSAKWQAASDAAKAVIDLGLYHLAPVTGWEDYAALFYDNDNPEGIWVKHYDPNHPDAWSDPESTTMGVVHTVPPGPGNLYEGWGTFDVTQNLIDKFQMADGTPYVKPSGITTENPWEGREIRLKANILCDGDLWGYGDDERQVEVYVGSDDSVVPGKDSSEGEYWWNASNTGYSMRKGMDPDYDMYGTTQMDWPWFYFRLSEIYLDYAECQIELGNNAEAAKYINLVRNRALLPDFTGDIRAAYRYERQMELLFEGQWWFDKRRWKEMDQEYNAAPIIGCKIVKYPDGHKTYDLNNVIDQRVWNGDQCYFYPIPQDELNKSSKLKEQYKTYPF